MIKQLFLLLVLVISLPAMAAKCDTLDRVEPNHLASYQEYQDNLDKYYEKGFPEEAFAYYCIDSVEYQISKVAISPKGQPVQDAIIKVFTQLEATDSIANRIIEKSPTSVLAASN